MDLEKAITHLVLRSLPTGQDEAKLICEVGKPYSKNTEMFGLKIGEYKPYLEKQPNPYSY